MENCRNVWKAFEVVRETVENSEKFRSTANAVKVWKNVIKVWKNAWKIRKSAKNSEKRIFTPENSANLFSSQIFDFLPEIFLFKSTVACLKVLRSCCYPNQSHTSLNSAEFINSLSKRVREKFDVERKIPEKTSKTVSKWISVDIPDRNSLGTYLICLNIPRYYSKHSKQL